MLSSRNCIINPFVSYKLSNIRFYSSPAQEAPKFRKALFYEHQFFIIADTFSEKKVDALAKIFNSLASDDHNEDTHKVNVKVFVVHKGPKNQSGFSPKDKPGLEGCIVAIKTATKFMFQFTNIPIVSKAWTDMEKLANSLMADYDNCLIDTEHPKLDSEGVVRMINAARGKINQPGIIIDFKGSPFEISYGHSLPTRFNPLNQDLKQRIRVINLTSYSDADLPKNFPPKAAEKPIKTESSTTESVTSPPTLSKESKRKKKD